jgi:enamine deaminase RidA (YjgF/YER057c/UK114 family)
MGEANMDITRLQPDRRMSQAVIHGDTIFLSGQVGAPGRSCAEQTRTVLSQIDTLLVECGSDRSRILSATIWLADMAEFSEMNEVWDGWVGGEHPPARATGEARLASPAYKVEIIVVAAR